MQRSRDELLACPGLAVDEDSCFVGTQASNGFQYLSHLRRPHHHPPNPLRPMRKMLQAEPVARGRCRLGAKIIHRSRDRRSVRRVLLKAHLWFLLRCLTSTHSFDLQLVTKPSLLVVGFGI